MAEWLFEFVSALRHQRGVVHRVLALFGNPSNAVWYQHPPTSAELNALSTSLAHRIGRFLERRGIIERDAENAWLVVQREAAGPLVKGGTGQARTE